MIEIPTVGAAPIFKEESVNPEESLPSLDGRRFHILDRIFGLGGSSVVKGFLGTQYDEFGNNLWEGQEPITVELTRAQLERARAWQNEHPGTCLIDAAVALGEGKVVD